MRIIFIGTPDFAVASLQALIENNMNVVAVITAPDKAAGRGLQLQESAVKKYAVSQQIPVLQPVKLKDEQFLTELKSYQADLQIVVAFRMLPELVWNMPSLGTINVHASLLPNYRGAAPINWAIINGEKTTGVSTFKLKHQIDTGNVLLQKEIPILEEDTAGTLHDKLMLAGANLLVETILQLQQHTLTEKEQLTDIETIHAPKIFKNTCEINWSLTCEKVYDFIRGLSPYPAAHSMLNGKILKVFKTSKIITSHQDEIGTFKSDGKTYLQVACSDGYINILELQLEGKKKMNVEDFLRGNKIN